MSSELPVTAIVPQLANALARQHVVLTAPPGSGKTTAVPLALWDAPWLAGRKILMLEPRRPAARMAARRLARQLGEAPGGRVGYQVRLERCVGPDTRIEVVTEGILTRRLQQDPSLADVGLVIFDEFHERNLQTDLGLALCVDVCASLRDDLRLLLMSATLDPAPLCTLLGAEHVAAEGRQYPVEVSHLPPQDRREPLATVPSLVRRAIAETAGDVLVFLPGRGEIERVAADLDGLDVAVERLFGDLPAADQDRILAPRPAGARRVILSTDLAESSLTIEGVTAVVDSGLARKPVFDPNCGMTRLQRQTVSAASATQRAGRAGRLGPGRCFRAWTQARQERLPERSAPEMATADLAGLVLELALWGVNDPRDMAWLDPPPEAHWNQGKALLQSLDALDEAGRITALGRRMGKLGLEPRLARLLLCAQTRAEAQLTADLAALVSERDLLRPRGPDPAQVDLSLRLMALAEWRASGRMPAAADGRRLQAVDRLASRLKRRLGDLPPGEARSAGVVLSLAYPDRIARQRGGLGRFVLSNGRGIRLDESDALAGAPWLVVPALDAGRREGRAWLAMEAEQQGLLEAHQAHLCDEQRVLWDDARQAVVARRIQRLGAIEVAVSQSKPDDPTAAQTVLLKALQARWPDGLNWTPAVRQWLARARRLRELEPDGAWPALDDASLRAELPRWLGPWLADRLSLKALRALDLLEVLQGRLDWSQQQRMAAWLPSHFETPAGSRRAIDYDTDGSPRVAVPLQEMFGQQQTPKLADGRLALVLELLSPAQRPLQVTADLANFWQNAYVQVRKELRGRYPKHDWPEDPAATPARRGTGRPRRR